MVQLCGAFMDRLADILYKEGVSFDSKGLADLIMKHAPDWRRVLNECQRRSISGSINSVSSSDGSTSSHSDLVKHLKHKDFKKMRAWVANNIDVDASAIFRSLYDRMYEKIDPASVPQLVVILADYQFKNAFVADHELNVVACLTEVMANVNIK